MKLQYFSWIPAAIIMVLIFIFSSQEAKVSDETSLSLASRVYDLYEDISNHPVTEEEKEETLLSINMVVRKIAHSMEYGILSFFIAFHLFALNLHKKKILLYSIFLSFFYAITDEIHQLFVPGRSGQIKDVLIDTSGALIASIIFLLVLPKLEIIFKRKYQN